jgi:hypothetical protein
VGSNLAAIDLIFKFPEIFNKTKKKQFVLNPPGITIF